MPHDPRKTRGQIVKDMAQYMRERQHRQLEGILFQQGRDLPIVHPAPTEKGVTGVPSRFLEEKQRAGVVYRRGEGIAAAKKYLTRQRASKIGELGMRILRSIR